MQLRLLQIHSFLALRELQVQLDTSPLIFIEGENDQGKTSFCQAICFALFGEIVVETPEHPSQWIHWESSEASVSLTWEHHQKEYRVERLLKRSGEHYFRFFESDEECFATLAFAEKQKAMNAKLGWNFSQFTTCLFWPQKTKSSTVQKPLALFQTLSQLDLLEKQLDKLTQQINHEKQAQKAIQEEQQLLRYLLESVKTYEESLRAHPIEDTQDEVAFAYKKTEFMQRLEQFQKEIWLQQNVETYLNLLRSVFKKHLQKKIFSLAAQVEEYLEESRIREKEQYRQNQISLARKKSEWKERLIIDCKIHEFRRYLELFLKQTQHQLDDQLVRNVNTSPEDLCLSTSRVAQLTYVQNEEELVLRDNKIRNFMFYSVLVILMLTTPVFFYLKSLENQYYRHQLKVQATGGFLILLILILIWYFSQKLKNNQTLANFNVFKVRLQQEIAHLDTDYSILSKYFYGPISQIELEKLPSSELRHFFKELLFQSESQNLDWFRPDRNVSTAELNSTRLPKEWDFQENTSLKKIEQEIEQLEETLQHQEKRLEQLRLKETVVAKIPFDYEENFVSRSFTSEELEETLEFLQKENVYLEFLNTLTTPSEAWAKQWDITLMAMEPQTIGFSPFALNSLDENSFAIYETQVAFEKEILRRKQLLLKLFSSFSAIGEQLLQEIYTLQELSLLEATKSIETSLEQEKYRVLQKLLQMKEQWHHSLETLSARFEQGTRQIRIQEVLHSLWQETRASVRQKMLPAIEKMASSYLPFWTQGAFGRVCFSPTHEVLVFSAQKNDFISFEQLGPGRQQFILLALYFAFAQGFNTYKQEETSFLLLDSPDLALDTSATQEFWASLQEISSQFSQIIITTSKAPSAEKIRLG